MAFGVDMPFPRLWSVNILQHKMKKLKYCTFRVDLNYCFLKWADCAVFSWVFMKGNVFSIISTNYYTTAIWRKIMGAKNWFSNFHRQPFKNWFIPCTACLSMILALKWGKMIYWSSLPKRTSQHSHLLPKRIVKTDT